MAANVGHAHTEPIIAGYLFLKGYFGDWRSRFVELHGDAIVYRFVKGGMEWRRIPLSPRTKCEDNSERHFCFVIADSLSGGKLYLAATNTSLKEAWTEAIHGVLTSLRFAERRMKYGDQNRMVAADEQHTQHKVYIKIIQARNLLAKDTEGFSDPYVKVTMGSATARTTTRKKNLNPDWGMVFPFSWDQSMRFAKIEVWDEDLNSGDRFLGMVLLPIYALKDGDAFTAWYPLGKRTTRSTVGGDIEIELACSGMPDRESKAWRLFYHVQQLPDLTMNLAATTDGNGQIALDFDTIRIARKDKTGHKRCLVGDTDSVSSDDEDEARTSAVGLPDDDTTEGRSPTTQSAANLIHGFPLRFPPIELEKLEDFSLRVHLKCLVNTVKFSCPGMLMLTNYRLIFLPNTRIAHASTTELLRNTAGGAVGQAEVHARSSVTASVAHARREIDLSTQIPVASIIDIAFSTDSDDSGPHTGSTFETIKITTTDCRVVTFRFVEDVDALAHKHLQYIQKTFGNILRGVGDNLHNVAYNVADNIARRKDAVLNDLQHMNAAIAKTFGGDTSRDASPTPPAGASDPSSPVDAPKRKTTPSTQLSNPYLANGHPEAEQRGSNVAGSLGPSKLEKCWLRLIKEPLNEVEGLDSEEGTPGQRMHFRIKHRVINRASEKSIAINTNMTLLHTLRTACGLNPSAPQYFFHSIAEYDAVAPVTARTASTADSTHAPSMLPMGWTSFDGPNDPTAPNAGPTKTERLREDCTLNAVVSKVTSMEPLHNVYTKLLYNVENSWLMYDPHNEFKRMGVPNANWRISYANVQYELCDTYPAVLAFPATVDDESLSAAAPFRSKQRLPTLCWRSTVNNATISRSSQPMVGLGNSRNAADEFLLREMGKASITTQDDGGSGSFSSVRSTSSVAESFNSGLQLSEKSTSTLGAIPLVQSAPRRYVITDARPLLNARANQAAGKGVESDKNYENCSVVFLDIANIHAMRKSLEMMVEANGADDANWLRNAEAAGWLGHIRRVLLGASKIAHFLSFEGLSVLVHCSDGWDRTSQLTSLSMLMMDGYYRTLKGFIVLIEKEWLSFGHKFGDRQGWTGDGFADEERSPIFAQFLDCVHQFLVQMPDAFEFNEQLLLFLVQHLYSGWFGNFLFNSEYELKFHVSHKSLLSIWTVVLGNRAQFRNPHYRPRESPVVPVVSKSKLVIWSGWFLTWQDKIWNASWIETNQLDVKVEARVIDGKTCFKCEAVFTFTRRKHHCRCCGQIFCYDCCHARRIVPAVSSVYRSRCCNECALLLDMDYFTTETPKVQMEKPSFMDMRASLTHKALLS